MAQELVPQGNLVVSNPVTDRWFQSEADAESGCVMLFRQTCRDSRPQLGRIPLKGSSRHVGANEYDLVVLLRSGIDESKAVCQISLT